MDKLGIKFYKDIGKDCPQLIPIIYIDGIRLRGIVGRMGPDMDRYEIEKPIDELYEALARCSNDKISVVAFFSNFCTDKDNIFAHVYINEKVVLWYGFYRLEEDDKKEYFHKLRPIVFDKNEYMQVLTELGEIKQNSSSILQNNKNIQLISIKWEKENEKE